MNRYKSILAEAIDKAVRECIDLGSGWASTERDGGVNEGFEVMADWDDNENDINVTLMQNEHVLCVFVEPKVSDLIF